MGFPLYEITVCQFCPEMIQPIQRLFTFVLVSGYYANINSSLPFTTTVVNRFNF